MNEMLNVKRREGGYRNMMDTRGEVTEGGLEGGAGDGEGVVDRKSCRGLSTLARAHRRSHRIAYLCTTAYRVTVSRTRRYKLLTQ